jgi:hypothetical protein
MMNPGKHTHTWYILACFLGAGLLLGVILASTGVHPGLASCGIDTTNKWAWGTNTGWINFASDYGCVMVYSDHLEGYAWGENTGWIRLGAHDGGGSLTYANDSANTYGVNNDGVGNLSGYAWGASIGWINFAPTNGGVAVDPVTGDFEGYAWAENLGWIHFQSTSGNAYKVTSYWHSDLDENFQNDIAAIITARRTTPASSGGLTIANSTFLNDSDDGIIFGHNGASFANLTENLPSGVAKRWARVWDLDVHDGAGTSDGNVTLTFDISDAGGSGNFSDGGVYYLLKRPTGSSDDFTTVTVEGYSVNGDQLTFTIQSNYLGSEFTLGAAEGSPTALEAYNLLGRTDHHWLTAALIICGFSVIGLVWVGLWKKQ